MFYKSIIGIIILSTILFVGCDQKIERSGVVVDKLTNEPIPNVSIEIYLKNQRRDSLIKKVFTDRNGYFHITEKRSKGQLFELNKIGYISHVNSLSVENDTIELKRSTD
jgi:uncharacterized lipoprotein YajG